MGRSSVSLVWLALAIALSAATQLRFSPIPLGAGELLLAGWIGAAALALIWHPKIEPSPLLLAFTVFGGVALLAIALGALGITAPLADDQISAYQHDFLAFALVTVMLVGLVALPGLELRLERTASLVLTFTIVPMLLLWVVAQRNPSIGPFAPWYGARFRGWSENPNQLALTLTPAPFLALYLAGMRRGRARVWCVLLAAAAVLVGLASRSDALVIAWSATAPLVGLLFWIQSIARGARTLRGALATYVFTPILGLATLAWYGPVVADKVVEATEVTAREGHQGSARVTLWRSGLDAFVRAPVVGEGFGGHAKIATDDSFAEAHNTLIDWGSSTGLVGLVAYLCLLAWSMHTAWRARSPLLIGALVALFCFSMFHYVMRQPIYWFFFTAISGLARRRSRELAVPTRGGA